MNRKLARLAHALAIILMAFASAVSAQIRVMPAQSGSQAETAAMRAIFLEHQQREAALAAIAQDRASFVASLLDRFTLEIAARDATDRVRNGLTALLTGADPEKLYRASRVRSLAELQALLVGKGAANTAAASEPGETGPPGALGSPSSDLVYFPISPCRALDTRFASPPYGGPWAADTSRDVLLTDPILGNQGGSANCGIPHGPARAVVLNIAAVWPANSGYLRVYPYGESLPNASILNFAGGDVIANAVVAPICQLCAFDLTIRTDQSASQIVVDVLGYFAAPYATPLEMTTVTSAPAVVAENSLAEAFSPACPSGYTMTGGGYRVDPIVPGLVVSQSSYDEGTGRWRAKVNNPTFVVLGLTVYGQCSRVPGR